MLSSLLLSTSICVELLQILQQKPNKGFRVILTKRGSQQSLREPKIVLTKRSHVVHQPLVRTQCKHLKKNIQKRWLQDQPDIAILSKLCFVVFPLIEYDTVCAWSKSPRLYLRFVDNFTHNRTASDKFLYAKSLRPNRPTTYQTVSITKLLNVS